MIKTQSELLNTKREKHTTFIVKPTNDCNLDCKYCYDKPIREQMKSTCIDLELLEHSLRLVNQHYENVTLLWHGGEPTLMGHDYYYKATELMSQLYATKFKQQMQTNGLEINNDPRWINTFKDCDIRPGTSYDGIYQYLRQGNKKDYMRDVMYTLSDEKLSSLGGITIIHNDNLHDLIGYYDYIKGEFGGEYSLILNLGFSTEETQSPLFDVNPQQLYDEFYKLYQVMLPDTTHEALFELNFERNVTGLLKPTTVKGCEMSDCRKGYLTVTADGTLIPCSRFSIYNTFGNIRDYSSISEIYESDLYKEYVDITEARYERLCKDCKAFALCKGGCEAKFLRNPRSDELKQCEYIKAMYLTSYQSLKDFGLDTKPNVKLVRYLNRERIIPPQVVTECLRINGYEIEPYATKELDINNLMNSNEYKLTELFNRYNKSNNLFKEGVVFKESCELQELYRELRPAVEVILSGESR